MVKVVLDKCNPALLLLPGTLHHNVERALESANRPHIRDDELTSSSRSIQLPPVASHIESRASQPLPPPSLRPRPPFCLLSHPATFLPHGTLRRILA